MREKQEKEEADKLKEYVEKDKAEYGDEEGEEEGEDD